LKSSRYVHLTYDLADATHISKILEKVNEVVEQQSFEVVCLVNNASAVEPIQFIENCPPPEIEAHIHIGLISPMILTSRFIKRFYSEKVRKKVVFISSGAAFTPLPGASIYSSTKAGINMFTQCVGLEQEKRTDGFEVISIGPGMVDTEMQRVSRSKSGEEFAMADFFKQAFEDGKLADSDMVAAKIVTILENKYEQGKYVQVSEV